MAQHRADDPRAAAQPSNGLRGPGGRQLLSGFYIVNDYSGQVLDNSASTSNGAVIQQFQLYGGTTQRWDLVGLGNGNYAIFNEFSGKVLGDPGFSTNNGTGIIQWDWNGGLN
jgi:hypothetical protein